MRRLLIVATLSLLAADPSATWAIDHKNLDEGGPLRLEDAYPIAAGEWALEVGAGATFQRRSADRGLFPLEILYGAWPNLQLGIGTTLSTNPHEIDEQHKSGDLELSALYNFNQETLTVPALGVRLELNVPTGVDSSGVDVALKAMATKSFDRLAVHFNAAYAFLTGTTGDERDGRYQLVLGASYPVGAPRYTRTTLVGDVFTEQSPRRGDSNIVGAEIGFRHQLTPGSCWIRVWAPSLRVRLTARPSSSPWVPHSDSEGVSREGAGGPSDVSLGPRCSDRACRDGTLCWSDSLGMGSRVPGNGCRPRGSGIVGAGVSLGHAGGKEDRPCATPRSGSLS